MKRITVLMLCLAFSTYLSAQTHISEGYDNELYGFDQFEIGAIKAVNQPTCALPATEIIVETCLYFMPGEYDAQGEAVVTVDTCWQEKQSWQHFGQSLIANGLYNIEAYRNFNGDGLYHEACVGYVIGFANINASFSNAFSYGKPGNITQTIIKKVIKDQAYHEGVYQWLKPALILAWRALKSDAQDFYHGLIAYVQTFNYSEEKEYYESLKAKKQEYRFTSYEPNGQYEPRRKAKAWIFRRIYFDGWGLAYTKIWIDRIAKEVML